MKIEAGKFYRDGHGDKVGPMIDNDSEDYPWRCANTHLSYGADGRFSLRPSKNDLIAEWTEWPGPAPAAPDYNDGRWHAWTGGDCPVHPQSVVEVLRHDRSIILSVASSVNWLRGPFLFRVTKVFQPPKEPREQTFDPKTHLVWFSHQDGLIHVREVLE